MRRQRLVTAAVIGAVAAVLSTVTVATAPLHPRLGSVTTSVARASRAGALALTPRQPRTPALVIAHRGASGYLPEHTVEGYRLAIAMGADYIEADLVVTRDGVLVARHENELSLTTDVAHHPEFADRRSTRLVNAKVVTGWFSEDFTVAELRTLRAVGRTGSGWRTAGIGYAGMFTVPTLQEVIDLVRRESVARHRVIGLYLELKVPGYFAGAGLPPEPLLAQVLGSNRLADASAPVFVESFEADSLRAVHRLVDVPLVQLLPGSGTADDPATTPAALRAIRAYARGIGVDRSRLRRSSATSSTGPRETTAPIDAPPASGPALTASGPALPASPAPRTGTASGGAAAPRSSPLPRSSAGPTPTAATTTGPAPSVGARASGSPAAAVPAALLAPDLVLAAHRADLEVHVYTFANDSVARPVALAGRRAGDPPTLADALAEYRAYLALGIDGLFTDNTDTAVRARA